MTGEQARAIVNKIGMEALELYAKVQAQGEFTDRDSAQLVDLLARKVDYLDLLEVDPIPVSPFLSLDQVADFVEKVKNGQNDN